MYIIDVGEKYAKKTHTKLFQVIVNNLKEKNLEADIKLKSIVFINTIINFCHPSIVSRVLIQLNETGIFELVEKILKQSKEKHKETSHENDFIDQISIFHEKAEQIFSESEHKVEMIKKYIEDMNNHIHEIEMKNKSFEEQKEFYDYIVKNFIEYIDISDCISNQTSIANNKDNKDIKNNQERFDASLNKNIVLDKSGLIDVKSLLIQENQAEYNDLVKKYTIAEEEYENLKKTNNKLVGENEEVTNDEISLLEKDIKTERDSSSKFEEFKKELEKKIKELSDLISPSESKPVETQSSTSQQETSSTPLGNTPVPEGTILLLLEYLHHQEYQWLLVYLYLQVFLHPLECRWHLGCLRHLVRLLHRL